MKRKSLVVGVIGALLAVSSVASQAGFLGETIEAMAYFPDLPPNNTVTAGPVTEVVGAGIEFTDGEFSPFFGPSFDFADTTVTITHAQTSHQPGTFNGYSFFDVFSTIDEIIGVQIVSDSTGFFSGDPGRIFFDANTVFVNFESLNFFGTTDPRIVLGVTFGSAVPEPATLALFGLGLAGIGAMRRKKLAV